jgi:hypothetical protein
MTTYVVQLVGIKEPVEVRAGGVKIESGALCFYAKDSMGYNTGLSEAFGPGQWVHMTSKRASKRECG